MPTQSLVEVDIDATVVVPFYNARRYIEDCAKALLAQTYPPTRYEIIMVDNNSSDGSAELLRNYPRIKVLSERKQGSYAARNRGVAASRGNVIAFTDADCAPFPNWLEKIGEAMWPPGVELVLGARLYATESSGLSMLATFESERAAYTFSAKCGKIYYGYTNNMAVRRDLFERCGPFLDIERGADSIFVHRVIEAASCEAIRYASDARIRHLEMTNLWRYFRKKFIYGKNLQLNYARRKRSFRPLTAAEGSAIFARTVRSKQYSLPQTLHLMLLIWIAKFSFRVGRQSVIYASKRRR